MTAYYLCPTILVKEAYPLLPSNFNRYFIRLPASTILHPLSHPLGLGYKQKQASKHQAF